MAAYDAMPDDVTIREQAAQERDAVASVIAAAFGDPDVAELDRALAELDGGIAYVARAADEVVGHVRLSWGWIDTRDHLIGVLVLSPLSVAPSRHRQGIGQGLVARAIAGAEELGSPVLLLEGDPTFYARCGFVAASQLGIFAPSARIPDRAFQAVALSGFEPWMSGRVVYPEAFWRHDAVGLRGDRLDRALGRLGHPPTEFTRDLTEHR